VQDDSGRPAPSEAKKKEYNQNARAPQDKRKLTFIAICFLREGVVFFIRVQQKGIKISAGEGKNWKFGISVRTTQMSISVLEVVQAMGDRRLEEVMKD